MNIMNFEQFKKSAFDGYINDFRSMGLLRTEPMEPYWFYQFESDKKQTCVADSPIIIYGKAHDGWIEDYGYLFKNTNAGYVNTGHGHAMVEKEDGITLEETLYKAYVHWKTRKESS